MIETKKRSSKLLSIILLVIGIILIAGGSFLLVTNKSEKKEHERVLLKDDFYEAINGEKINSVAIPTDSNAWSTFYDAQVMVNTKKQMLIQSVMNDPNYENKELNELLDMFNDYETRNKLGVSELKPYFDMIDNAKTIEEFNNALITVRYDLDVTTFVNFDAADDIRNSTKKVLVIQPSKVEDMYEAYTLDKFKTYKQAYIKFRKSVLKAYGYDDQKIEEVSNKIDDFVAKVQANSTNISSINDITKLYNYYTMDDIKANIKNVPIVQMLTKFKVADLDEYVFYDMKHYIELDKYYTEENLDTLKEIAKLGILEQQACIFTSEDLLRAFADLLNDTQGTQLSFDDVKYYITTKLKESNIENDLNKKYEEKYFTEEQKREIREVIEEIKEYYKTIIKDCDWMQEETKKEALNKLEKMKVNIGYQEKEEGVEYEYKTREEGGTLLSNLITECRANSEEFYNKLEDSEASLEFKNLQVNAYYNSTDNSINFPAAFYELVGGEEDFYVMLGKCGSIVGHEISHAFDNTGSQFDADGKLRDWWTAEDKAKYNELKEKVVAYYNKYDVEGIKVDGEETLGENIADLAGLKAAVYVAEKHNATNDDYKKLFTAYAELWATKITKENLEKQVAVDSHSPNKVRVNAVLSSTDKFYEVYDITEEDKMYVPKEERVGLW